MGFNDEVLSDVLDYFTNESEIGAESLILWPRGDKDDPQTFMGVWDEAAIIGTNEAQGDGVTLDRSTGYFERVSITVECSALHPNVLAARIKGATEPTEIWFAQPQDPKLPDKVIRGGKQYQVKRIVAGDDGMISVRLIDANNVWRRQGGITG